MNGIFENSRGLRDLAKHVRIADSIREHKLDFVGISETGKRDFSASLLNRISDGVEFTWKSRPPRGRSGGLLLGVRKETMDVLASSEGEFLPNCMRNQRLRKSSTFFVTLVTTFSPFHAMGM